MLNPAASVAPSEASIPPPAYENSDNNSVSGDCFDSAISFTNLLLKVNELPPAYTIAIEDTGGFLNPLFVTDERAAAVDTAQTSGASDINARNTTNDNTLHI